MEPDPGTPSTRDGSPAHTQSFEMRRLRVKAQGEEVNALTASRGEYRGRSLEGVELGDDDDDEEKERFLPPSRTPSESESSIQSFELYTPDEDRTVLRKLDWRLVPFMALLYMLSFLDRSNIGNARIAGLERDLNLSSYQYDWLLTAFYITYIVFEWMTLMYRLVPPHIYISLCVASWGLLASLQSLSISFGSLLFLRALLGISEAAFGPGVPFYLSFFFRRDELAFRTGLFISAAPLATSFASSLAWAITKWGEGGPLAPWRLLFLLEGFPSIFVAVVAWSFIPDGPDTASFFTSRQKIVAVQRLRKERELASAQDAEKEASSQRLNLKEIVGTLLDPKCYLTALMFFSCNVSFSSMPVFLPTIIREMGHSPITSQALSAPPYLVSFVVVLLSAYISDRLRSRSTVIVVHSILAATGYALIAFAGWQRWSNPVWRYIGIYPATAGFFSAITLIITWTINNQDSDSKRGTGMAMLNVIGQCGPLVGTRLYPDKDGPYYVPGMTVCAIFMLAVGILALGLRWVLVRKNRMSRGRRAWRMTDRGDELQSEVGGHFEFIL
ncbi:major facilitator superfamily domain-containing protein [Lineolata rhizophorae]|uniref:Major facilitator superfamily domain-containing protein n=1 Tax=Lineolata rhizophorae TaxID=578093 RepID=A0A6A6P6F9_9PEZI|nr:major facilitator superfamily domain-containing protein [Lineolata rhizophorae]